MLRAEVERAIGRALNEHEAEALLRRQDQFIHKHEFESRYVVGLSGFGAWRFVCTIDGCHWQEGPYTDDLYH